MTDAEQLVAEIRAYCAENQDPGEAARYKRFFTEGYDPWGLHKDHPFWAEKQDEWLYHYSGMGTEGFFRAGELLFSGGKYEEGSIAIRFLKARRAELDSSAAEALAGWFRAGIRNWAHTDVLCGEVISPLLAEGKLGLAALAPWREAGLKFQRRAVPVAMLGLLNTTTPIGELLDFLRPLMLDPERVVQQGLGWFLREAWKKHPGPVEAFLGEWKDRAPRLIFQYATEKMTPAGRARFRRSRGSPSSGPAVP